MYFAGYFSSDEQLHLITAKMIEESDTKGDGFITLDEFSAVIKELDVEGNMSFISFR